MNSNYIPSVIKQFEYYKMLGEKSMGQLQDKDLFRQHNKTSNSIATIVKHLSGNMVSRWTDFMNNDGEKPWRNRDAEFENDLRTREDLLHLWNKGWECLFAAMHLLKTNELDKVILIRNEPHTVVEAINRQLAHYPYHIGQLVFIGKMICNETWISLSIPKGESNSYNNEKFNK